MIWLGVILGSYLLGSISFSYWIVRFLEGIDVRSVGSGNAGATNVVRAAGKWPGAAALALDVGKGMAAVGMARWLDAPPAVLGAVGLAVVLGHVFSLFLRFRGGKGVATAAGALGMLALRPTLLALVAFVGLVLWKRYVSLGSVVAALLMPSLIYLAGALGWIERQETPWLLLSSAAIAAVVVARHSSNLKRLWRGTESKIGRRSFPEAQS